MTLLMHILMALAITLSVPLVMAFEDTSSQPKAVKKLKPGELVEFSNQFKPSSNYNTTFNPYQDAGINHEAKYVRHPVSLQDEFSFQKLVEVIEQKKLTSIEQVISELPYSMKNDNYVLMYRSLSLQEASPNAPRAILYTPTASFILSFNGSTDQIGGNAIETIEFDRSSGRFEFREIVFHTDSPPTVSEANPAKCVECHQSASRRGIDLRPNWEPYSTWLGAYGSSLGNLATSPLINRSLIKERALPQDQEALEEQKHEYEFLKDYIENVASTHPRYSKLGHFNLHATVDLTNHLGLWNAIRVKRLASENQVIYSLYKELLAMISRCNRDRSVFLEESSAFAWHLSFKYPQYHGSPTLGDSYTTSYLLTQIFEPLGVDTSDWSMDFQNGGRLGFRERFGMPSNVSNTFKTAWNHWGDQAGELDQMSCNDLGTLAASKLDKAFSEERLEKIRTANLSLLPPVPTAQGILNRCASCHVGGEQSGIPAIPFDDPKLLTHVLNAPTQNFDKLLDEIQFRTSEMAPRRRQMPPSGRLTPKEREVLIDYLKGLK